MANRYTNLGYSTSLDIPLLQMPFQQLDALLGSYQKSKDDVGSLVTRDFANLKEDQELADQVREYQKSVKDQLIANFERGNADAYMASLRSAKTALDDLRSPSGAINALESRVKQKQARDKRIREFYKDVPEWAEYFTSTTPLPDINYSTANRTYNPISENLPLPKYIDPADIESTAQKAVSSLKDSLLKEGYSKKQLDNITTLHDFYKLKGITADRIQSALLGTMNDEQLKSLVTQENVDRYRSGNKPDATVADIYPFDNKGNFQSNFLGRMFQNKIKANIRKDITHDRIKDNNELALHKAKKQIDEEYERTTNTTFLQQLPTKEVKEDLVKFLSNDLPSYWESLGMGAFNPFGVSSHQAVGSSKSKNIKLLNSTINDMRSGKMDNKYPDISQVMKYVSQEELDRLVEKGDGKAIVKKITDLYSSYYDNHKTFDVQYNQYGAEESADMFKEFKAANAFTKANSYQVIAGSNDLQGKNYSAATLAREYGMSIQEFEEYLQKTATLTGESRGEDLGKVSSGIYMRFPHPNIDNEMVEVKMGTNSVEEQNYYKPIQEAYQPVIKGGQSPVVDLSPQLGEGFRQSFPNGLYTKSVVLSEQDQLYGEAARLRQAGRHDEANKVREMAKNASSTKLIREVNIYDPVTNEYLGDQNDLENLVNAVNNLKPKALR